MMRVKPFAAVRPPKNIVTEVAAPPYDVLNSEEAKAMAGEKSLLHITKPEIDFNPIIDEHSQPAYDKAVENFKLWQEKGWLVQDKKEEYYVYAQTMDGRTQYGIVLCAHTDDYSSGKIKKHELTRKDKEDDRMVHVRIQDANIEPVFFAYRDNEELNRIVENTVKGKPAEYDFVAEDGFGHHFWVIDDDKTIARITEIFAGIPAFYVADGHHRTAAAARVGAEKRAQNPHHTGDEEYNFFMAVVFPESQLKIIDYNRVVKDLNGMTPEQFIEKLKEDFEVEMKGKDIYAPAGLHNFSMYLGGNWYSLTAKPGRYDDKDPIGVLDVTVLSNLVFDKLLDIKDLRTSKRIDFVGGIRGLGELSRRVDSGEMVAAFALYPVTMDQLITIADTGNIMPPKTTWFEPKLRSGLAIHKLESR
ncbi:hypothetical protein B5F83_01295 [Muribaculum sp. An289]|uniref:DUF1015 domain-containing protein n=1 Tax=Candidatus Merdivivens faecigallinarum TaxID=2840871 RepID=A0A9D9J1I4_9BACT|nr:MULTISPECIES: DUF1015 family protein [unclassified Muribaculum]MBO8481946.1 DUF1015 domain-containing protein [Candidatus Merdivivens faecigallinarum]OUO38523.1 hypothetical protein B5F83_01295 [Muribaculum sp. An289]OUO44014.1 hypothetical protein B5F81_02270 [Muribaculum sp. An287]